MNRTATFHQFNTRVRFYYENGKSLLHCNVYFAPNERGAIDKALWAHHRKHGEDESRYEVLECVRSPEPSEEPSGE